ncbi:cytoplasmic protein [Streptomyces dioscori]|uniref:Cytoplasmic protein n=1 Tax=Streptomyces dioscori TaxID=2109333 RepID=A0A2P8Q808_9ACTN|nr:STM4015 family protein [Streptomyces dioscori]PSM42384.1 cytoplasmic protein [Streptomyces dioscori]
MSFYDRMEELYGLPAYTFPAREATTTLPAPDTVAWRINGQPDAVVWRSTVGEPLPEEECWDEALDRFCAEVDTTRVRALIVGSWDDPLDMDPSRAIEALLAARDRLPALRSLFLGDIVAEECEISMISQTDVTPLLAGFPALEEFGVRAGESNSMGRVQRLEFPALRHDALRRLTVQSGGLPVDVVRGVGASELPALEHLDLWLGVSEYGGDCAVADLEPILYGDRFPRLRHLALRNSEIQDEIAVALASAPVVARLEVLDLSMGTLGDDGAAALLAGQPLTHLKKLDLHHNFLSEPFRQRICETLGNAGVEVDVDRGEAELDDDGADERYVSVAE